MSKIQLKHIHSFVGFQKNKTTNAIRARIMFIGAVGSPFGWTREADLAEDARSALYALIVEKMGRQFVYGDQA